MIHTHQFDVFAHDWPAYWQKYNEPGALFPSANPQKLSAISDQAAHHVNQNFRELPYVRILVCIILSLLSLYIHIYVLLCLPSLHAYLTLQENSTGCLDPLFWADYGESVSSCQVSPVTSFPLSLSLPLS